MASCGVLHGQGPGTPGIPVGRQPSFPSYKHIFRLTQNAEQRAFESHLEREHLVCEEVLLGSDLMACTYMSISENV